jgi:hypothetical protein
MLTSYVGNIFRDHRCGFRRNRSTTDILHSSETGEKWKYNGTVHQLQISRRLMTESEEKYCTIFSLNVSVKLNKANLNVFTRNL